MSLPPAPPGWILGTGPTGQVYVNMTTGQTIPAQQMQQQLQSQQQNRSVFDMTFSGLFGGGSPQPQQPMQPQQRIYYQQPIQPQLPPGMNFISPPQPSPLYLQQQQPIRPFIPPMSNQPQPPQMQQLQQQQQFQQQIPLQQQPQRNWDKSSEKKEDILKLPPPAWQPQPSQTGNQQQAVLSTNSNPLPLNPNQSLSLNPNVSSSNNLLATATTRWPALYTASFKGQKDQVELLLQNSTTDANATNPEGQTALFPAAIKGFKLIAEILVNCGRLDVNRVDRDGWNALYAACYHGQKEIVQILVKNSNINIQTKNGWCPLYAAANNGHFEICELLLNAHAEVNTPNKDGRTPLHVACEKGFRNIAELLIKNNASVNAKGNNSWSCLYTACFCGRADIVELLLKSGADVNAMTTDGWNPLCAAALNGRRDIAEILSRFDANFPPFALPLLEIKIGKDSLSAFKSLISSSKQQQQQSQQQQQMTNGEKLVQAANLGDLDSVMKLSHDGTLTIDWNSNENGTTALYTASKIGNKEIASVLIQAGCDINKPNKNGESPLLIASSNGHKEIVDLLIRANCDVNKPDSSGQTALISASSSGHLEIVENLIRCGANVSNVTTSGCSALYLAALNDHQRIAEILLKNGSDVNRPTCKGWTSLFAASSNGHFNMVQFLLSNNADPLKEDVDGYTACYIAAYTNHLDIVEILGRAGSYIPERFLTQLESKIGKEATTIVVNKAPIKTIGQFSPPPININASVVEVSSWLNAIGLAEHVANFAQEEIDGKTLLSLTEENIQKLGITKLGQQKKLLSAIQLVLQQAQNANSNTNPIPQQEQQNNQNTLVRYGTTDSEGLVYKGLLGLPPSYIPPTSCKEYLISIAQSLSKKIPQLLMIISECEKSTVSLEFDPTAHKLIEAHKLTKDEVMALVLYTYDVGLLGKPSENFYYQLNETLRRRNPTEMKELIGYLYFVLSALRKLPDFVGTVYRGNNSPDIVKKEYLTGREIFWSGFTSTTVDLNVAKQFAGSNGVVFRITINNGKVISAFSVLGGENEVLLPPNAGLFVARGMYTDPSDGMQYIDLVEKAGKFRW